MEIYNEEVKDLIGKGAPAGKKHNISHDDKGTTSVTFVESIDCKRPERVKDLLSKATRMRSVGKLQPKTHLHASPHAQTSATVCATTMHRHMNLQFEDATPPA